MYERSPGVKPLAGSCDPVGGENLKGLPFLSVRVSVNGLKDSFPENAIAVTISGEQRKFMVLLFASFRALKLL